MQGDDNVFFISKNFSIHLNPKILDSGLSPSHEQVYQHLLGDHEAIMM